MSEVCAPRYLAGLVASFAALQLHVVHIPGGAAGQLRKSGTGSSPLWVLIDKSLCRYIYNHKSCGRCGSSVRTWDMSARTCYACEVCQPLQKGTILDSKRSKALSAATNSKVWTALQPILMRAWCS